MAISHQVNTFYEWNGGWHEKIHIYGVYFLTSIPFHSAKFLKNSLGQSRVMRMCHLPICHEQNFLGTNHYYYFHLPVCPFRLAKFKKILTADPELGGWAIFRPKMVHLPQFFFKEIINITLIYLLAPFTVQNCLKNFQRIQSYEDVQFLGPK